MSRRASNAKDRLLAVEGHLVAGHQKLAAQLAWELAPQMEESGRYEPEQVARMYRNAGDAAWQEGRGDFPPGDAYRKAIGVLEKAKSHEEERAWLWLDLASWHWSQATFFPEDPATEFESAAKTAMAAESLFAGLKKPRPLAEAAAARLAGNAMVRRFALEPNLSRPANEGVRPIERAIECLERAIGRIGENSNNRLRSALEHDAGVAWLVKGTSFDMPTLQSGDALASLDLEQALEHLEKAVALRPGTFPTGSVDLRDLGPRLQSRAESLAFLARAQSLASVVDSKNHPASKAIETAHQALQLTTERDAGPAWIVAVATVADAEERLVSDKAGEPGKHLAEAVENALAGLMHYPLQLAPAPGMPQRRALLGVIRSACERARESANLASSVIPFLKDMEEVVRHVVEAKDRNSEMDAIAALIEILSLKADGLDDEEEERKVRAEIAQLRGVQVEKPGARRQLTPLPSQPPAKRLHPMEDGLRTDQIQRADGLLEKLDVPVKVDGDQR